MSIRVTVHPEILRSGVSFPRLQEFEVGNIIMLSDSGCPFGLQFSQRLYDPGCHFPGCRNSLSCTVAVAHIIMLPDPGCVSGLHYPEIVRSGVLFPRLQDFAQLYCSSN